MQIDLKKLEAENIRYEFARSSGPGGQNVNKVNTKVTLVFDLPGCGVFDENQKNRIAKHLKQYADKEGIIRIQSQQFRSQHANRNAVLVRLREGIETALKPRKKRIKTKIPKSIQEKRLKRKRERSEIKKLRNQRFDM